MDHQKRVYEDIFQMLPSEENPSPMVRINRMNPAPDFQLFAKLEWQNPFGSVKDLNAKTFSRLFGVRGHDRHDFLAIFADEIEEVMLGGFLPQARRNEVV